MSDHTFSRATGPLRGTLRLPTDKSISHRAVLFAAMAEGESRLVGVLDSADVRSTLGAVQALGAIVDVTETGPRGMQMTIRGWGAAGPREPAAPVDCGNSGTTVRLLMGVLAGWPIEVTLTGDASLSRRPMRRVTGPLAQMGARFETSAEGTLPIHVTGGALKGIHYESPVASAQVKSAVLLAGLRAEGETSVTEPALSRDHTELMLPDFGVEVVRDASALRVSVAGGQTLRANEMVVVPADPSSAAFMVAAGVLVPGSDIRLPNVDVNPTRMGFWEAIRRMGGRVSMSDLPAMGGEPVATLAARCSGELRATRVEAAEVASLIDEVPVLALVATQAHGVTRFEGVNELRVKESDRLEALRSGLEALGADVSAGDDWLEVTGPSELHGTRLASLGDHRLAMTWALAGLLAAGETVVTGFDAVDVSYPAFAEHLEGLAHGTE